MKILCRSSCLLLVLQQVTCFTAQIRHISSRKSTNCYESTRCFAETNPHDATRTSRRDLLTQATGLALSSLLLGQQSLLAANAEEEAITGAVKPLTFVMTGANSGIGFEACKRLSALGHRIVLACRTKSKAVDAILRLGGGDNGNLVAAECNLASLASITAFCNELPALLGGDGTKIDRLCLNAGLARNVDVKDCARTDDGFELTGESSFSYNILPRQVSVSPMPPLVDSRHQPLWSLLLEPFDTNQVSARQERSYYRHG